MSDNKAKVKDFKSGLWYILGAIFVFGTGLIFIFVLGKGSEWEKIYFWIGIVMCILAGLSLIFGIYIAFKGFKRKGGQPPKP